MAHSHTVSRIVTILKLLIGATIALALVKFAFFPAEESTTSVSGQGDFTPPTVEVTKGDITNSLTLPATVVRNASLPVRAQAAGTISKLFVASGTRVTKGAPLVEIAQTLEGDGGDAGAPAAVRRVRIPAPGTGTLTLEGLVGQEVSIGDSLGSILPDVFHAEVPVTPDQLYKLESLPGEGELAIKNGPAPFACVHLTTHSGPRPTTAPEDAGTDAGSTSPQIRCDIPADQRVFDGVTAKLTITGAAVSDVLTLPVTAVEGRFRTGRVYLPARGKAKPKPVTVQLGISDGTLVQITGGLDLGTKVLEFVPSATDDEKAGPEGGED